MQGIHGTSINSVNPSTKVYSSADELPEVNVESNTLFDTRVEDLIRQGYLTEDGQFLLPKDERGIYLLPHQTHQVYGYTRTMNVPKAIALLASKRQAFRLIRVTPQMCADIADAMDQHWLVHGVFPFDADAQPEPYIAGILPNVVKKSMVEIHHPYHTQDDMIALVQRYTGAFIEDDYGVDPATLTEREMVKYLQRTHQQPVITRLCATEGCMRKISTPLKTAVMTIAKLRLLPWKDLVAAGLFAEDMNPTSDVPANRRFFQPHTVCFQCAKKRRSLPRKSEVKAASRKPKRVSVKSIQEQLREKGVLT